MATREELQNLARIVEVTKASFDEVEKQRLLRLADSTEQQISFIENCSLE